MRTKIKLPFLKAPQCYLLHARWHIVRKLDQILNKNQSIKQSIYFLIRCILFFHTINKSFWNEQRKFHRPFITRVTPLADQGLLTPPGFDGVRVARCLVFCVVFCGSLLSFCTFSFGRCALSVLLRSTDSDYPSSIFKLFLHNNANLLIITSELGLIFHFR